MNDKISIQRLAADIDVTYINLRYWLQSWRLTKFVSFMRDGTTKPKQMITLTSEFYKNMCKFLESRKNSKYINNFKEKYSYLE